MIVDAVVGEVGSGGRQLGAHHRDRAELLVDPGHELDGELGHLGLHAGRFLVETLTSKPSVRGLDRLIELKADGHLQAEASDDILKAVTERLMSRQPAYRCKNCGFSGQTHHWQCPSCRQWSTTRKIHGVLGE